MASSYSTDLKLELMVTGENSGTWGDKTNTNLNLLQQAIAGYQSIALTSTNTTLAMSNATISDARNAVIKFTGTLSANTTVYVDSGIEKTYIIENGTTGAYTLALNQVGGASVIWATTDKSVKQIYLNGTDAVDTGLVSATGVATLTNKTLTSPIIDVIDDSNGNEEIKFTTTASAVNELTVANAATGNAPEISSTGDDTNIDIKITPKGTGKVVLDGIKYPNTDGTSGQVLSTDGAGNLSFTTIESSPTNVQSSFVLSTNKSTVARNVVSISKLNGQIGTYSSPNAFNTSTITQFENQGLIYRSLDGTHALMRTSFVISSTSTLYYKGVYTPHGGTPVIANTSFSISNGGTAQPNYRQFSQVLVHSYASNAFIVQMSVYSQENDGSGNDLAGSTLRAVQVNTSGAVSLGTEYSTQTGSSTTPKVSSQASQINNTILCFYPATANAATANARIITISSNLTTLISSSEVDAYYFASRAGNTKNFGFGADGLLYYPTGNSVFFQTVNATASTLTTIANQSISFHSTISSWKKVGNLRWLATYTNVTSAVDSYATFDVNATTAVFTLINETAATASLAIGSIVDFIGSVADQANISTNLTTAILSGGTPYKVNTLGLNTTGQIEGFNIPLSMSPNVAIDAAFLNTDNSTLAVLAFSDTSFKYRNYFVNDAATDEFNYVGIATANDTTSPASVATAGVVDGYSNLSIGSTYYADVSNGNITTITSNVIVGYALTSTQVLIKGVNL